MSSAATTSLSGWNFAFDACVRRTSSLSVLASILAVPERTIRRWKSRDELPTPRAVNAMKRYLADLDTPKITHRAKVKGPRGEVGKVKKREKPAYKLRTAERRRYGHSKRLFTSTPK